MVLAPSHPPSSTPTRRQPKTREHDAERARDEHQDRSPRHDSVQRVAACNSVDREEGPHRAGRPEAPHAAFAAASRPIARSRPSPAPCATTPKAPRLCRAGQRRAQDHVLFGCQEKSCFFDPRRAIGMQLAMRAKSSRSQPRVRPQSTACARAGVTTANFNARARRLQREICLPKRRRSPHNHRLSPQPAHRPRNASRKREFAASATPGGGAAPGGVRPGGPSSREKCRMPRIAARVPSCQGRRGRRSRGRARRADAEHFRAPAGRDADARADDDEDDDDDVAAAAARTGRAAAGAAPPAGSSSVLDRRLSATHVGAQAASWTLAPDFERVNLAPECAGHGAKPVGAATAAVWRSRPPFEPKLVGALSAHGQKARAKPKPNQDRALVAYPVPGPPGKHRALFVVADGHGRRGDACPSS